MHASSPPPGQSLGTPATSRNAASGARERWTALLLRSAGALGLVALLCAPSQAQTIRLAHGMAFPPFAESSQGVSKGLAVDVVKEAAKRAGLELVFVPIAMQDERKILAEGKADGVFPLAINPERRETMNFTTRLLVTGGALFT